MKKHLFTISLEVSAMNDETRRAVELWLIGKISSIEDVDSVQVIDPSDEAEIPDLPEFIPDFDPAADEYSETDEDDNEFA